MLFTSSFVYIRRARQVKIHSTRIVHKDYLKDNIVFTICRAGQIQLIGNALSS